MLACLLYLHACIPRSIVLLNQTSEENQTNVKFNKKAIPAWKIQEGEKKNGKNETG